MNTKLPLFVIFTIVVSQTFSQDTRLFAITGQTSKNLNWTDIRRMDIVSGTMQSVLYENGKTKFSFVNAETGKSVEKIKYSASAAKLQQTVPNSISSSIVLKDISPTTLMSAAVAYDKRHERLFFSTMTTGQLVWMDALPKNNEITFYTLEQPLVYNDNFGNESLNVTRMTIGADGQGYALTNDGTHLVRFNTGSQVVITDLGSLSDAENNKGISIHDQVSSWGGDIVADAFDRLYLLTASRNIFKIDIKTKIATYMGAVQNLSPAYTLNGAAVVDNNSVVISSANTFEGFYKVNMNDFSSEKLSPEGQVFNASDLASSNLLFENEKQKNSEASSLFSNEIVRSKYISLYPNPVSSGRVIIDFDENPEGRYKIDLTDLQGRMISSKIVFVKNVRQLENFHLSKRQVGGVYFMKISDETGKSVFSDKLIVE